MSPEDTLWELLQVLLMGYQHELICAKSPGWDFGFSLSVPVVRLQVIEGLQEGRIQVGWLLFHAVWVECAAFGRLGTSGVTGWLCVQGVLSESIR